MKSLSAPLISALSLALLAQANPVPLQWPDRSTHPGFVHPSNGDCKDMTLQLTITYPEMKWIYPPLKDDYDSAASLFNFSAKTGTYAPFAKPENVTKTFEIAGTYCTPKNTDEDQNQKTLLVMTHGAGFDRRYWASSYKPESYSWVQHALNNGYSTFYYDRLGIALSKRISGYEIQAIAEQEILAAIVKSFKEGATDTKPQKVILVGHSLGSFISNSVIATHPDLVDAAVLTGMGYAANGTVQGQAFVPSLFASRIANQLPASSAPQFADTFDSGWLSFADVYAYLLNFQHQPDYEVDAAKYAYSITQPTSIGDFTSAAQLKSASPEFKGKVMVTTGQFDFAICDGNCDRVYAQGLAEKVFPSASQVLPYVQPNSGHSLNFEKTAPEFYAEISKFLAGV